MSGHSKWSTIKHKKGAADAKRGKVFTKLIKEITIAARIGGGDLDANPRLRTAVEKGKSNNMPADNITRAIKKGTGDLEGVNYEEGSYEGYGPGGVAVIVTVLTDNRNRTTAEVRHAFSKYGGNMGENGCVSFMFDKKGLIVVNKTEADEEKMLEIALEAGAEDMSDEDETFEIYTDPTELHAVKSAIEAAGITIEEADISMIPQNMVNLQGKTINTMLKLMDVLEDNDDVQNVYANFDFSEEEMEALNN
jgi:YebC/PmpR family DNA-binding regulatory protein